MIAVTVQKVAGSNLHRKCNSREELMSHVMTRKVNRGNKHYYYYILSFHNTARVCHLLVCWSTVPHMESAVMITHTLFYRGDKGRNTGTVMEV